MSCSICSWLCLSIFLLSNLGSSGVSGSGFEERGGFTWARARSSGATPKNTAAKPKERRLCAKSLLASIMMPSQAIPAVQTGPGECYTSLLRFYDRSNDAVDRNLGDARDAPAGDRSGGVPAGTTAEKHHLAGRRAGPNANAFGANAGAANHHAGGHPIPRG